MPTLNQIPVASGLSLGRLRLVIYGAVVLVAVALWLAPRWFIPSPLPESSGEVDMPLVNNAALKALANDLQAWKSLLQDPRLDDLQASLELRSVQPGNPSPFFREVTAPS